MPNRCARFAPNTPTSHDDRTSAAGANAEETHARLTNLAGFRHHLQQDRGTYRELAGERSAVRRDQDDRHADARGEDGQDDAAVTGLSL